MELSMDRRLNRILGAAALAAVMATPAAAGGVHVGVGINLGGPPVVVAPSPPPPPPPAPVYPWAPAPGLAPAYTYYYYPGAQVYFDPGRGLWFWMGGGRWLWGPALPPGYHLGRRHVVVPMMVDRPYVHHRDIRRHYPSHWRGHGPGRP